MLPIGREASGSGPGPGKEARLLQDWPRRRAGVPLLRALRCRLRSRRGWRLWRRVPASPRRTADDVGLPRALGPRLRPLGRAACWTGPRRAMQGSLGWRPPAAPPATGRRAAAGGVGLTRSRKEDARLREPLLRARLDSRLRLAGGGPGRTSRARLAGLLLCRRALRTGP